MNRLSVNHHCATNTSRRRRSAPCVHTRSTPWGWRVAVLAAAMAVTSGALGAPAQIPYTGRLTYTTTGAPFNGEVEVQAKLFASAVGGGSLWTGALLEETWVEDGVLSFVLEGGTPLLGTIELGQGPLWLEIRIDGTTLSPRQAVLSVPYALRSGSADTLAGSLPSTFVHTGAPASVSTIETTGAATFGGGVLVGESEDWTNCTTALAGALRYDSLGQALLFCNGEAWLPLLKQGDVTPTMGGGGSDGDFALSSEAAIMLTQDLAPSTHGGSSVASAWTVRPLNTKVADNWALATLSGGQFTLPPGTYSVEASQTYGAHVGTVMQFRSRLRNLTDAKTEAISLVCRSHVMSGNSTSLNCPLSGIFTLDGPKTLQLEYWASSALANVGLGFGTDDTSGEPNRMAQVLLRRIGEPAKCGQSEQAAAPSCQAVRACGFTANGEYWLDSDGSGGPLPPFQVWCDQSHDGGGWALIAHYSSGTRIGTFNPTQSQYATGGGGGAAPATYFPTPASTTFGHMAYTRFSPAGRQVMVTCGSTAANPTEHRFVTPTLFNNWNHGDKGTYGASGSPGWAHISSHPNSTGRGLFWLCGTTAAYSQWGIALCSGPGAANSWSNHLASFSNQSGSSGLGCAGAAGARMMVWIR